MTLLPWLPWLALDSGATSIVCPLVSGRSDAGYWWAVRAGKQGGFSPSAEAAWREVDQQTAQEAL